MKTTVIKLDQINIGINQLSEKHQLMNKLSSLKEKIIKRECALSPEWYSDLTDEEYIKLFNDQRQVVESICNQFQQKYFSEGLSTLYQQFEVPVGLNEDFRNLKRRTVSYLNTFRLDVLESIEIKQYPESLNEDKPFIIYE